MARSSTKLQEGASPTAEPSCVSHPGVLAHLLIGLGGNLALDQSLRRLVFLDPALCLHTLRAVAGIHPNALLADMDLKRTLEQLGTHTLKQLALGGAVAQLMVGGDKGGSLDQVWRQAVATAVLSRDLAAAQGYRNLEEAWLAGLLTHLPNFVHNAETPEAARLACLAQVERIPLRSFLPDVLRYLDEPAERLRDAALLIRCALAAHRLVPGLGREPISPTADGAFLSQPIPSETLGEMLQEAKHKTAELTESIHSIPPGEVTTEILRFVRLEVTAGTHGSNQEATISALTSSLAAEERLFDPIYLALDKRSSSLVSQPLGDMIPPAISLRMEGSNTAAVRALFTRSCVVAYADASDTALLDLQLIRQANAEGLAALPVGEGGSRGVLLVFGDRDGLEKLASDPRHYTRLGELVGKAPVAPIVVKTETGGAVDDLTGRIRRAAHEVNNPLGIIKNYLAILKVKLGDDAPIVDELRIIHEELDRIVRIVRGMLQEDVEPGDLSEDSDINTLIDDMVKVTAPSWHAKGVRVHTQLTRGLPRLSHDRDKLKQIILNLLLNALEATPDGGTVRLETAAVTNNWRERFLEIQVTDSGPGIPPERMDALFEPVHTDKGEGHAGLGLSIVKHLTESLEGFITYKSGTLGATIQISLPLA